MSLPFEIKFAMDSRAVLTSLIQGWPSGPKTPEFFALSTASSTNLLALLNHSSSSKLVVIHYQSNCLT